MTDFKDDFDVKDTGNLSLDFQKKVKKSLRDATPEKWEELPRRLQVQKTTEAYDSKARVKVGNQYPHGTYYFFGTPKAASEERFNVHAPMDDPLYVITNHMKCQMSERMNYPSVHRLNGGIFAPYPLAYPTVKDQWKSDPLLGFFKDTVNGGRPIPGKAVLTPVLYVDPVCADECPGAPKYNEKSVMGDKGEYVEYELVEEGNHTNPVVNHIPATEPVVAMLAFDILEFKAFVTYIKERQEMRGEQWDITGTPFHISKDTSTQPKQVYVRALDEYKWETLEKLNPADYGLAIKPQDYSSDLRAAFTDWLTSSNVPYVSEDERSGKTVAPWDADKQPVEKEQTLTEVDVAGKEDINTDEVKEEVDLEALRKEATDLGIGWTEKTSPLTLQRRVNKKKAQNV